MSLTPGCVRGTFLRSSPVSPTCKTTHTYLRVSTHIYEVRARRKLLIHITMAERTERTGARLVLSVFSSFDSLQVQNTGTVLAYVPPERLDERTSAMLVNLSKERYINVYALSSICRTKYEPTDVDPDGLLFNLLISPTEDQLNCMDVRDLRYVAADLLGIGAEEAQRYTGLWHDVVPVFKSIRRPLGTRSNGVWMRTRRHEDAKFDLSAVDAFNVHATSPAFAFSVHVTDGAVDSRHVLGDSYRGVRWPVVYSDEPSRRNLPSICQARKERIREEARRKMMEERKEGEDEYEDDRSDSDGIAQEGLPFRP